MIGSRHAAVVMNGHGAVGTGRVEHPARSVEPVLTETSISNNPGYYRFV